MKLILQDMGFKGIIRRRRYTGCVGLNGTNTTNQSDSASNAMRQYI